MLRQVALFLAHVLGLAAVLFSPVQVMAQGWPSAKPIKFVVPYSPGGFADLRARQVAGELSKALGQQIIIENKAGAGGVLGVDQLAKSAPDGYTIGMGNLAPLAVNRFLMKSLPYDVFKEIQPVILIEISPPGLDLQWLTWPSLSLRPKPSRDI